MSEERKPQTDGKKSSKKAIDLDAIKHKLDVLEEAIAWVAQGKTLRDFCRQEGYPSFSTIYNWLNNNEEAAKRFARAREDGHDVIAEECFNIADEIPPMDANGRIDPGYVSWQKNRIWTRTQLLAKWNPNKYGDKTKVEHEGGVTLNIITGIPDDEA